MKKILNVKSWILRKTPQFRIVNDGGVAGRFRRIKDGQLFASGGINAQIYYENRKGNILEFMADYVHVQIEVRKANAPDYPGIEFDSENYEYIEVPINDVRPREVFISPGVYTKESDNSSMETSPMQNFVETLCKEIVEAIQNDMRINLSY